MAYPFGGHPTLAEYMRVNQNAGLQRPKRIHARARRPDPSVNQHQCIIKRWVVVVGIKQNERLVPTMVEYLDRRLGLTSRLASIDDSTMDPE